MRYFNIEKTNPPPAAQYSIRLLYRHALQGIKTEYSKKITDELFDSLTKFFYNDKICNLTLAITQINTRTRLNRIFLFTRKTITLIIN